MGPPRTVPRAGPLALPLPPLPGVGLELPSLLPLPLLSLPLLRVLGPPEPVGWAVEGGPRRTWDRDTARGRSVSYLCQHSDKPGKGRGREGRKRGASATDVRTARDAKKRLPRGAHIRLQRGRLHTHTRRRRRKKKQSAERHTDPNHSLIIARGGRGVSQGALVLAALLHCQVSSPSCVASSP